MKSEENKNAINFVRQRYHQLNLSIEQAEKVYQFEKLKDIHLTKYSFSTWEEEDFMLDNFQKILDEKQLKKITAWQNKNRQLHEQDLRESDKEEEKYLNYTRALIHFYEETVMPEFLKQKRHVDIAISIDKPKVDFLKQEYKKYLDAQKLNIVTSHYRHNKLFAPNKLQVNLLIHKVKHIIPGYAGFKNHIDKPTKAIADFLIKKYDFIPQQLETFFNSKQKEYSKTIEELRSKYIGETKGGSVTITETEKDKHKNQIMQVILMDKQKYGC